jgi:hypothetical protein
MFKAPLILTILMGTLPSPAAAYDHLHRQGDNPARKPTAAATIPKEYKAVCRSRVVKVQTEKWLELRKRQRCYTN